MRQSFPKECKFFKDMLQSMFIKCCKAVIVQKQCCHNYLQNIVEQHHRLQALVKKHPNMVTFLRTKKYLAPSLVSGLVELRLGLYHTPQKNKMSLIWYLFKYIIHKTHIYIISTHILSGIVQSGFCWNQA